MFLKRITIVGFKSFAGKTVLNLERGMTAVVGPNGSGKSNIADAVRWALGEQSKSRLRLGDREEVVFAGNDKRARASLAEVVLLFDNEAGTFPLDLTEVEISRRLYRSGETEYRLAGRPVRLGDLQQLLAEAGFGMGSYAVIGQGTIDSLLLSSPAERKLLFEEAAGIRGAELSREASMRKLAATETNLVRLRDIAAELAPRATALERARTVTLERDQLATRVAALKATIVGTAEAETTATLAATEQHLARLASEAKEAAAQVNELEAAQSRQLEVATAAAAARTELQASVRELETQRDEASRTVGAAQALLAEAEQAGTSRSELVRRQQQLEGALSAIEREHHETGEELISNQAQAKRAASAIDASAKAVAEAQAELLAIRQQLTDGTRQQYVGHALALVKIMARSLNADSSDLTELKLLIHKTGRLLSHASRTGEAELVTSLKTAQTKLEAAMAKRETAAEHQTNVVLSGRSLELDQTRQEQEQAHLRQELALVQTQLGRDDELRSHLSQRRSDATAAANQLKMLTTRLDAARDELGRESGAPAGAVAALAVQLERARNQTTELAREIAAARTRQTDATARQTHYRHQAATWQVSGGSSGSRSLAELEELLGRLEGELAARIRLADEQRVEYDEVTTRQNDLIMQITDLEAASRDLEAMVAKLSQLARERFKVNFDRLGQEFSLQANRIFDGGQAGLTLIEDDDGQFGIQIKVSPKGKRLANLAALSGGERAMAGVALLASILKVNPSPFVVLDEIDAALDDANSCRLGDIMTELAEQSQLIVITHNRQTMKAARVLFGVTMNDSHVSHLLSLRLEQATELAAR